MEKFPEFLISKFETRADGIEFGTQERRGLALVRCEAENFPAFQISKFKSVCSGTGLTGFSEFCPGRLPTGGAFGTRTRLESRNSGTAETTKSNEQSSRPPAPYRQSAIAPSGVLEFLL
ncbi:MAG: hypothetical protein N3I86_13720, partial [Verrucomicrobiae bacterium]|nr:hypothetical protein [Verrucomicrobiae bacterium]